MQKSKFGLVAQPPAFAKGNYMKTLEEIWRADQDSWLVTLINLLPLWLLSLATMREGFPQPPISLELAVTAFILAIAVSILLLWRGWLAFDLLLYTFFPLVLLFIFDEIDTSYKSLFILLCALILSIDFVGAQRSGSFAVRSLILFLVAIVTWVLAAHAARNYWQMVGDLGYGECFPGTQGCPPLTGKETPWWAFIFSL